MNANVEFARVARELIGALAQRAAVIRSNRANFRFQIARLLLARRVRSGDDAVPENLERIALDDRIGERPLWTKWRHGIRPVDALHERQRVGVQPVELGKELTGVFWRCIAFLDDGAPNDSRLQLAHAFLIVRPALQRFPEFHSRRTFAKTTLAPSPPGFVAGCFSGKRETAFMVVTAQPSGAAKRFWIAVPRVLLGLMFGVLGMNGFVSFIPPPPVIPADAASFAGLMATTHFSYFVFGVQVLCGLLLLVNRYVKLALVMLAAVIANIFAFHITMWPSATVPMPVVALVLWFLACWPFRREFAAFFLSRP